MPESGRGRPALPTPLLAFHDQQAVADRGPERALLQFGSSKGVGVVQQDSLDQLWIADREVILAERAAPPEGQVEQLGVDRASSGFRCIATSIRSDDSRRGGGATVAGVNSAAALLRSGRSSTSAIMARPDTVILPTLSERPSCSKLGADGRGLDLSRRGGATRAGMSTSALTLPPRRARADLAELLSLAGPVIAARIGIMVMGLTDAVVVGRYSATELGYHALGWAPTSILLTTGVGLLLGVQVMTSQAIGEGRPDHAGLILRRGSPTHCSWAWRPPGCCLRWAPLCWERSAWSPTWLAGPPVRCRSSPCPSRPISWPWPAASSWRPRAAPPRPW